MSRRVVPPNERSKCFNDPKKATYEEFYDLVVISYK